MRPNTIVLKGCGRYDEGPAGAALSPGHFIEWYKDGTVRKLRKALGLGGLLAIAIEDSLQGKTITDAYAANDPVRLVYPKDGDVVLARIPSGQSYAIDDSLIVVNGEVRPGTASGANLYRNTAASAAIGAGSNAEVDFDKTYALLAGSLLDGDEVRVRAGWRYPATHTTDTSTVKLYLGATTVVTSPAVDVANDDGGSLDATFVFRTTGATGTVTAGGLIGIAATQKNFDKAEWAVDTTAALTLKLSNTFSVADAGNSAVLDYLIVDIHRGANGGNPFQVLRAVEAINNTDGSNPFIRVQVP